jgi:hypothetical protein
VETPRDSDAAASSFSCQIVAISAFLRPELLASSPHLCWGQWAGLRQIPLASVHFLLDSDSNVEAIERDIVTTVGAWKRLRAP